MSAHEFALDDVVDAIESLDDRGLMAGETATGTRVHAVDFNTDSAVARSRGDPDKLLCGDTGEYDRADAPARARGWCRLCLKKLLHGDHGLRTIGRAE